MTNTNMTNPANLTDAQISALRSEAASVGDLVMVDLCDVALSGVDSDGSGTTLGLPCTVAHARAEIATSISNAEAMNDEPVA